MDMTSFDHHYQIRSARPEDADLLAPRMREIDCREVWAISRQEPAEALRRSLECSARAWAIVVDGLADCLFGVSRLGGLLGFVGSPWLLGSDVLDRPDVARDLFIRRLPAYDRELGRGFRRLENFVHAENKPAIRWLKWLGYNFAPEPTLVNGEGFFHFWRNCPDV